MFSKDRDKQHIDNAVKALRRAFEYASPLRHAEILLGLSNLQIRLATEFKNDRLRMDKQDGITNNQAIAELANVAIMNLNKSSQMAQKLGNKAVIAAATANLGRCYQLLDKKDDAEECLKKGCELYDMLIAEVKVSPLRISSEIYTDFNLALDDLCSLLISNGKIKEALAYTEVGKAREMLNVELTKNQLECSEREEYIDYINSLNEQLREINEKRKKLEKEESANVQESLRELDDRYLSIFQERRKIEDVIWKKCPDPGVTIPKDPIEIVDRFIYLSNNIFKNQLNVIPWALLEFVYLDRQEELIIFMLDHNNKLNLSSVRLSSYDWNFVIPKTLSDFRKAIESKSYDDAEKILLENAVKLDIAIIPDIIKKRLEELKIQQLMVVADGPLHNMPFELITDKKGSLNECWGIKYSLVRGFSLNHFSYHFQIDYNTKIPRGLIVGNPTDMAVQKKEVNPLLDSSNLWNASLPNSEKESESIENIIKSKNGNSIILLKDKASKTNFIEQANAAPYSFIHFAGHAKFDNRDPDKSYLLLNKNGQIHIEKLYANEISTKIHLKGSPLVTLSSCDSGVSTIMTGNEAFGLIRGFTLAGASNLVLSGWPVFDDSAKEFMEVFYTELLNGHMISESITLARSEILKRAETSRYNKKLIALHWSSFQLSGEPIQKNIT